MKRRVLLIAATTGYQTRVFAEAGERIGLEVVLATDRCHVLKDPWGDHAIPLRFEDPVGAAEAVSAEGPFDAVVAVGDRPSYIAALAAERLGLPFHTPEAVMACRDKYLARERLRAAGLQTPWYRRVSLDRDPEVEACATSYPCVLKPLELSASRGVIRANTPEEFVAAFLRIRALLQSPELARLGEQRSLQVERYIPGREFALEGLLTEGKLQVLAVFDKPDPMEGPFFEETIYTTPSRRWPAVQRAIVETTKRAVRALGLARGPLHAEVRVNERGVWMLEAAARPIGGLCSKCLQFTPEMTLEEVVLRHALGEDVSTVRPRDPASGVMMIPIPRGGVYTGVEGLERAESVAGITEVLITAKEGQTLVPLPEGSSYLGFIFARGDTPDEVERALREAHAELEFQVSTALAVLA